MAIISKENYIFVYNLDDIDSLELAQYYADFRELEYNNISIQDISAIADSGNTDGIDWEVSGQLVGIRCSSTEILSSETEFNYFLLNPLRDVLRNSSVSLRNIFGIILGYNVPGGFYYDGEYKTHIISSTSRISHGCVYNNGFPEFSPQFNNKLYDRKVFARFEEDDSLHTLVCARLDGPNYDFVKNIIDQTKLLHTQYYVDGTFYFDPYSTDISSSATKYREELLSFYDNYINNLNLEVWKTTFMGEGLDIPFPLVTNDSFVWSWGTSRSSSSFFSQTNSPRVLFYNADTDGINTLRDVNSKRWGYLSLLSNYCSVAGSMSDPDIEGFLSPQPLFDALRRGATLGEAYLFSCPYMDWTTTLIGDPLIEVGFPFSKIEVISDLMGDVESWYQVSKELSRSIAYFYRKGQDLLSMENVVVDSQSLRFELEFLAIADAFRLNHDSRNRLGQYSSYTQELINYAININALVAIDGRNFSINDFMEQNNLKISSLLNDTISGNINEDYLLDEGWWEFEYIVQDDDFDFVNYHFILEVFEDICFENLLFVKNSFTSQDNWYYEYEQDKFANMPISGVSSSFVGRRIKYVSPEAEYLERGQIYYLRIKQYNILTGEEYLERTYKDIIFT